MEEYVEKFKLWLRILGLNLAVDRVVAELTDWSEHNESSYLVLDFESEFDRRCDYFRSKFDHNILKVPDFSLEFGVDRCSKGEL